jgi:2-phosphosulfolactate phosphatase
VGEQDGTRLGGFDLGGTPEEFQRQRFSGKTLVWALPHDPIFGRSFEAVEKLVLSFVNMEAVVHYLETNRGSELIVVCAGEEGRVSLEDAVAGGMLLELLGTRETDPMNDGARAAWILYLAYRRDLGSAIRDSVAGQGRLQRGKKGDLVAAMRLDAFPLVPVGREGRFTLG